MQAIAQEHRFEAGQSNAMLAEWAGTIKRFDSRGWTAAQQGDTAVHQDSVHNYLKYKLYVRIQNGKCGTAGWTFSNAGIQSWENAYIWADGASSGSQQRPLTEIKADERWWPCIVATVDGTDDEIPMYCPALAFQSARPWYCHRSRIFNDSDTNVDRTVQTPGPTIESDDEQDQPDAEEEPGHEDGKKEEPGHENDQQEACHIKGATTITRRWGKAAASRKHCTWNGFEWESKWI